MRWPWSKKPEKREDAAQGAFDPKNPYQRIRQDNWQNQITGLGTFRDKMQMGTFFAPFRIQDNELLAIFNGSDLGARTVECRPKEAFRRGYELEPEGDDEVDEADIAELTKNAGKLRANELMEEGGSWGRLFGGALMIMGCEDGREPDQPLNEDNIKTVRFLNVIDRRFIFTHRYYNDPLSPNYGLPETYLVTNGVGGVNPAPGAVVIHESRCIRFDGARTDILTRQQLAGWTWSTLQRPYEQLRAFEQAFQSVNNLMSDASQAVFKMENLISMLASNEKDNVLARMQLVDESRSVCRAVVLDAEKEDFTRQSTPFAGIPDLLDKFMMRLSAAVEIPVTILMGRSAAGMNATGDADFRWFYDSIAGEQEKIWTPRLKRLYHVLSCAKDSPIENGTELEWKIKWKGLWQPSDTEQAKVELDTATKDNLYVTMGAITPEEVALSRWGKNGFVGTGMSAFDEQRARAGMGDDDMFSGMLNPPPELQGSNPGQMGEQHTPVATLPGPVGNSYLGGDIKEGTSPYGASRNPVTVLANMSKPPEEQKPAPRRDSVVHLDSKQIAGAVLAALEDDYDISDMDWIKTTKWSGPRGVDASEVDFTNEKNWTAADDPDKVKRHEERINKGIEKPIITVRVPGKKTLDIVDGHHRAMAARNLGRPIMAFIGKVPQKQGPWQTMHEKQLGTDEPNGPDSRGPLSTAGD